MKKLLLIISAWGLFSFSIPIKGIADNTLKVGIYQRSESVSLRVNISKLEGNSAKVKLVDAGGKIVYLTQTSKNGNLVAFNFDFANAKSGEYLLIVTSGSTVVKKEILKIQNALSY